MRAILKSDLDIVTEARKLLDNSSDYDSSRRVRDILRTLYSSCCAYCECSPEEGSFFHIEHFYPKDEELGYAEFRMSFENLHYSCQRCNTIKGKRDCESILSPNYYLDEDLRWVHTETEKIERELFYVGHLLFSKNIIKGSKDRGAETIKFFNLNNLNGSVGRREALVESRLRHFAFVTQIIDVVFHFLTHYMPKHDQVIDLLLRILIQTTNRDRPYSTMIIHNYGDTITQLCLIFNHKR